MFPHHKCPYKIWRVVADQEMKCFGSFLGTKAAWVGLGTNYLIVLGKDQDFNSNAAYRNIINILETFILLVIRMLSSAPSNYTHLHTLAVRSPYIKKPNKLKVLDLRDCVFCFVCVWGRGSSCGIICVGLTQSKLPCPHLL